MKKIMHAFIITILISVVYGQGLTTSGVNGFIKNTVDFFALTRDQKGGKIPSFFRADARPKGG